MTRILTVVALLWLIPGTAFKTSATAGSRVISPNFHPFELR